MVGSLTWIEPMVRPERSNNLEKPTPCTRALQGPRILLRFSSVVSPCRAVLLLHLGALALLLFAMPLFAFVTIVVPTSLVWPPR